MYKLLFLVVIFLSGIWHVDLLISCSARCPLTNGFFFFSGMQIYHLSMYLEIASFLILAVLYIREKQKAKPKAV